MTRFYRIHDFDPELKKRGALPTQVSDLEGYNRDGWAIYHTCQLFDGRRRQENLKRILCWVVDIDGDKDAAVRKLNASPLVPSRVVETKNGYHAYWDAKNAKPHRHKALTTALVQAFDGDKNARDLCRILRTPGFQHQKDPADPFTIREVHRHEVAYTEEQIAAEFGVDLDEVDKPTPKRTQSAPVRFPTEGGFWQRAIELDCAWALERLSGHWLVGGEIIELKPTNRGKRAIWCDGKGTSCWVDAAGKIGSSDGGGPSIVRWCAWYGHSWRDIAKGLKEVFPRLDERRAA